MFFKRWLSVLLLFLFLCLPVAALAQPSFNSTEISLNVDTSYRQDQLKWSIAGNTDGSNPNILSELSWDDLRIYQIRLHGSLDVPLKKITLFLPHFSVRGAYGFIQDGNNQDSDYHGDDRTQEYSRTNNSADQGNTLDLSVGAGLRFPLWNNRVFLTPMIGYSYHEQNLTLQDGNQTTPETGPFDGLDSSYSTRWQGHWFGFEFQYKPTPQITIKGLTESHRADYYAKADWNLIPSFAHPKSFDHHAKGNGLVYELGIEYQFKNNWFFTASGTYQKWKTRTGRDRLYLTNGTTLDTQLNAVNLKSSSLQIGLIYQF